LQSGDLDAAKSACDTLKSSPAAQGSGPFAQALQQIGNALDSNDLDGAQHGDTEVTAIVDSTNKVDITK